MEIKQFAELKKNYVTRAVGNEMVIVPLTDKVAQMSTLYTLNETGRFIWENVDDAATMDSLAALLVENFDIDIETAKIDVQKFFDSVSVKLLENKNLATVVKTETEKEKPKGKTIFQFWKK
jgi:hypothetical protein